MSGKILRVTEDFLDDFIEREDQNESGYDESFDLIEEIGNVEAV